MQEVNQGDIEAHGAERSVGHGMVTEVSLADETSASVGVVAIYSVFRDGPQPGRSAVPCRVSAERTALRLQTNIVVARIKPAKDSVAIAHDCREDVGDGRARRTQLAPIRRTVAGAGRFQPNDISLR